MSDTVITVENLSKEYRLGVINHGTLRQDLQSWWARMCGREDPNSLLSSTGNADRGQHFLALDDVSFEVQRGEILGIIGRNGAGKSTLLKILSKITAPTRGRIKLKGRVASLLEVGTGFHPELTGRENVFLNGAILGMSREEVRRKFDEILAFAEVEQFIDTPVKRYSSGMYVRLAFAVAAHLEPEIFVVDEVLAVGDTVFQKKCIDKMLEVSKQGRTVLFVSHNFSAVKALCSHAVLLKKGKLVFSGGVQDTIEAYTEEIYRTGREIDLFAVERKKTAQGLIFEKIIFSNYPVEFGKPIKFMLKLKSTGTKKYFNELDFGVSFRDKNQNSVMHLSNRFIMKNFDHFCDNNVYEFEIENILKPDTYTITLFLRNNEIIQDWLTDIVSIEVQDGNPYGFHDTRQINGVVLPKFSINVRGSFSE